MIDRAVQRALLERLQEHYPGTPNINEFSDGIDEDAIPPNLKYLEEHELVKVVWAGTYSDPDAVVAARINAKGLDFLADDGGLSAILNTVTIKLHQDDLKALLLDRIEQSPEPETVKTKLRAQIVALPAEGAKQLTLELIKRGISRMPDFASTLEKLLS